ncbi:hypothetical protein J9P93_004628 [Salmonella enterica]|nr:hypothetical protein [Salmonella enterica]EDT6448265.1 hypothetical protein [Salmonella enterica subsp. enterica]EEC0279243.1 hypothetical protein [Salmonella enterica subsp. enterica]EGZ3992285.1 hypothetical protein [Salmonella enterica subsp. enterica serovar Giza]EHI9124250.1 hypothetical protein [Salmonella enterica]
MISCRKCGEDKPLDGFYPRNKVCKECTKKRVSEYQKGAGKLMHNKACREYNKSEKGKIALGKARDNYLESHRQRQRARWGDKPLKATHKGNFMDEFGIDVECYVLNDENKTAVVSGAGLARLLGLGDHMIAVTRLLNAQYMSDFIGTVLREKMEKPFKFQWHHGGSVFGSGESNVITSSWGGISAPTKAIRH